MDRAPRRMVVKARILRRIRWVVWINDSGFVNEEQMDANLNSDFNE